LLMQQQVRWWSPTPSASATEVTTRKFVHPLKKTDE
jgi:hypothetical protein